MTKPEAIGPKKAAALMDVSEATILRLISARPQVLARVTA